MSERTARRFVFPEPGETISMVAKRVLPDVDDGAQLLLSWNLHLAMRPFLIGAPGELLPTDIVYVEQPVA